MKRHLTQAKIWRLILSLVAVSVGVSVWAWLARTVEAGQLLPFDTPMLTAIKQLRSEQLDIVMIVLSQLGGGVGAAMIVCGVGWWLARRGRTAQAIFLIVVAGGAGLINTWLKLLFARERPDFWQQIVQETTYSFPSGHAMGSAALACAVVVIAWRSRWRWWVVAGASVYTVLVGVSRMYLGVHYPSDIVAGWLTSAVWTALAFSVLYGYTKHKQHRKSHGQDQRAASN